MCLIIETRGHPLVAVFLPVVTPDKSPCDPDLLLVYNPVPLCSLIFVQVARTQRTFGC